MPNIPYRTEFDAKAAKIEGEIRARRGGRLLNLDRILLHSPSMADGWNQFLLKVRAGDRIGAFHRELAICAVARITGAAYEFHYHGPRLLEAGGVQAQLDALSDVRAASADETAFDPACRAVLMLAWDSTTRVELSGATLAALRAAFPTPEEVTELLLIVACYNMVARVLVGAGIEIEGQEVLC